MKLGGIMIFGLESLLGILKRNSVEKIDGGIYAKWYGNTILAIFIALILNDILLVILIKTVPILILISPFVVFFCLFLYLVTRRSIFGVTKNNFVYIKLRGFLLKEKEVYEIPIKNIRYLDVKSIFYLHFVKLYFISDIGKFKKVKFNYASFMLGFDKKEYQKNFKVVNDRLLEVQKVLDKGDF